MNRADEKTGEAHRAERNFSRSGEQCAVAEDARREYVSVRASGSRGDFAVPTASDFCRGAKVTKKPLKNQGF